MRVFECNCGQPLFFDNRSCEKCKAEIGFDPKTLELINLSSQPDKKRCSNHQMPIQCNWVLATDDALGLCESCRLTQTTPISNPDNDQRLSKLEASKRRWLYGVFRLGIPVVSFRQQPDGGLAFDFLEDQAADASGDESKILTGHANGLITLNVAEADAIDRVIAREQLNEQYRTLVGHFRHESGHFFWDQFIKASPNLKPFRTLFGDERQDYSEALEQHYKTGLANDWQDHFISSYASSHPWEDWAESWAHYLHLADTLETAASFNLCKDWEVLIQDFDQLIASWLELAVMLNELNRSMGQNDSYPFTLRPPVIEKLEFIHNLIRDQSASKYKTI
ncbi:putative zinc-binding metallopeptidase [Pontiellaceae bacterium B1224]|nr:putative zinc-binding metallopeptidase [Pontiellaceae bacterium B1224]